MEITTTQLKPRLPPSPKPVHVAMDAVHEALAYPPGTPLLALGSSGSVEGIGCHLSAAALADPGQRTSELAHFTKRLELYSGAGGTIADALSLSADVIGAQHPDMAKGLNVGAEAGGLLFHMLELDKARHDHDPLHGVVTGIKGFAEGAELIGNLELFHQLSGASVYFKIGGNLLAAYEEIRKAMPEPNQKPVA